MDHVSISVPSDGRFVQLLRLSSSSMASLAGFDVEAVEDVKIVADGMFALLLDLGDGSSVDLEMSMVHDGRLRLVASTTCDDPCDLDERGAMNERVLGLLSEEYALDIGNGRAAVTVLLAPDGRVDPDPSTG